jgi:transposase
MERPHYPADLRERVLAAMDAGLPAAEISRTFGISARSLRRWRQWQQERGTVATKPRSGRPPKIAAAHVPALQRQVAAHADATLAEHCTRLAAAQGVVVSRATMSRQLAKLGLPLKQRA